MVVLGNRHLVMVPMVRGARDRQPVGSETISSVLVVVVVPVTGSSTVVLETMVLETMVPEIVVLERNMQRHTEGTEARSHP